MGHIREGKYLDSGIWLILQMGPDEAGRLIRRARGGDASARSQLEHCMIKFLQNPGLAAAVMEDASLLDVELVPAEPRGEGGKADWKRLRLDLPIGKRGRGRPPIQSVAALMTSLAVGEPKKGRPPTGGGLEAAIKVARPVLRDLINNWRAAEGIPSLSEEERQNLRPLFGSIVGMADSYTGIPPDFRVFSEDEELRPVFLDYGVHQVLWRCITRSDPPTRSADCLIGELIGASPDQVSRKAGTSSRTRSDSNVRRGYLERSGIRILLEAPREIDEVEWDQAAETAGHIVRRYNTFGLLQRAMDGVDMSLKVPWEEVEGFWYRNTDRSWHITRDKTWGVIRTRKKRGKPTSRSRRI